MFSTLPGLKCLKMGGGLSISISSLLPKLGLKVLELFLVSNMFKATPDVGTGIFSELFVILFFLRRFQNKNAPEKVHPDSGSAAAGSEDRRAIADAG